MKSNKEVSETNSRRHYAISGFVMDQSVRMEDLAGILQNIWHNISDHRKVLLYAEIRDLSGLYKFKIFYRDILHNITSMHQAIEKIAVIAPGFWHAEVTSIVTFINRDVIAANFDLEAKKNAFVWLTSRPDFNHNAL